MRDQFAIFAFSYYETFRFCFCINIFFLFDQIHLIESLLHSSSYFPIVSNPILLSLPQNRNTVMLIKMMWSDGIRDRARLSDYGDKKWIGIKYRKFSYYKWGQFHTIYNILRWTLLQIRYNIFFFENQYKLPNLNSAPRSGRNWQRAPCQQSKEKIKINRERPRC